MKKFVKQFIPPIVSSILKKKSQYGFSGNYPSWQQALGKATGYDSPAILEKVKDSILKVKRGEAAFERDSVTFDHIEYFWPVLAGFLWVAVQKNNELSVLDFGGSLGSSYFQNLAFLRELKKLDWNVVEQKNFVECGKEYLEGSQLHFHYTIEECIARSKPDVFFASSVIQYLEKPYEFLESVVKQGFEFIIIDRTPFLKKGDRLTLQRVRPGIYDASYPAWFLDEERFLSILRKHYVLHTEFDSLGGTRDLGDVMSYEKGFILKKKSDLS